MSTMSAARFRSFHRRHNQCTKPSITFPRTQDINLSLGSR